MLAEVFYWVLSMSIAAALVGCIVLLLRKIRAIPRRIAVFLWLIPFLRMAFPLGLSFPYSLMSLLPRFVARPVVFYQPNPSSSVTSMNFTQAADSYFPITYSSVLLGRVFGVASILWAVVSAAILLTLATLYITTMRELRDAVPIKGNVYQSDKLRSPAVFGIRKPKVILPAACAEQDVTYILLHERMHIRTADNLWRVIAFGITAVHWFNPLAWVFLKQFLSDLELACDERVLAVCGKENAKAYARSLLACNAAPTAFVSAFGGAKVRTRIERILSFRKATWLSVLSFSALVIAVAVVLLTNAG